MGRRKLPYKEGDWFAVPLDDGGYALGLAARVSRGGIVLGYFFSPRYENVPSAADSFGLTPSNAIDVCMFGDLGLLHGKWPVICQSPQWRRDAWPLPEFGRFELMDHTVAYRTAYDENDLSQFTSETRVSPEEAHCLPDDCLHGYLALESHLNALLA
jgi:hypothetical protein